MTDPLVARAEAHDFKQLFVGDLNWSAPDLHPITYTSDDGEILTATNVSSYKGLRVWVCNQKPDSKLEAELDHLIAKSSTDRLVIFYDGDDQVWRWPVRRATGNTTTIRLSRHRHRAGVPNPAFAAKLAAIRLPTDVSLDANTVLTRVRSAFDVESHNETRHASQLMARLYTAMEQAYPAELDHKTRDHQISVTLARVLFMMFGDDTDMWAPDLFRDLVHEHTDGSDINVRLTALFDHLDTPDDQRNGSPSEFEGFPFVNGRIFRERITLPVLNPEFRNGLLDACARDWATISPAIFGSMFQSVRDAGIRHELGEHYTSEENILKTLNPLFLDELRAEFDHIKTLGKYQADRLRKLRDRLGQIRYMDPACGCGNFIIVAYRELRDLELAILERLQELSGDDAILAFANLGLKVHLDHFYGIEIDEWPARIAETAMFLIDRQCDLKLTERLGSSPHRLPIKEQATIVVDNALRTDWQDVVGPPGAAVVIAGNPPFLGISLRSAEQTEDLQQVWGDCYHGTLDYVTGWHAKAMDYYGTVDGRWALVSTNSITQGEVVAPLFGEILRQGWRIRFAHRPFRWTSEAPGAAIVHCVIIGFERELDKPPRLFDYATPASPPVELVDITNITPYLTDGPSIIVHPTTHPLNPQLGEVAYGNKPTDGGWLLLDLDEVEEFEADPIAAQFVRPYVGAHELLHGHKRYCLWLVTATPTQIRRNSLLRERVAGVRAFREASKAATTRAAAATAHLFRQIAQPSTAYLCIPRHVSENRPYFLTRRYEADVICSDANFLAADPDGFVFAVISSSMFITWQRTVGGRLESRLRFNKLLTWNTFPLPDTDPVTRQALIDAGAVIIQERLRYPDQSLADLYTPGALPAGLQSAHDRLDEQMDRLFGSTSASPTELERQDLLFDRYQVLTTD